MDTSEALWVLQNSYNPLPGLFSRILTNPSIIRHQVYNSECTVVILLLGIDFEQVAVVSNSHNGEGCKRNR